MLRHNVNLFTPTVADSKRCGKFQPANVPNRLADMLLEFTKYLLTKGPIIKENTANIHGVLVLNDQKTSVGQ